MPEKSNEIVPAGVEPSALLTASFTSDALALIDENLGGAGFSILSLSRVRVPTGGALSFRIGGPGGEESAKQIKGVIVAWRMARIYWHKAFGKGGGKKPPDCTSTDGFIGIGDPGGVCKDCPYARYGSAISADGSPGAGQACKDVRQALVLLPGEMLPHLMNIPPTSVKAFGQYTLSLVSRRVPYWAGVTEFTLDKATNENGIDYARISFRMERPLEPKERAAFEPYHERMKEILLPSVVDTTAYEIIEDEPRRRSAPADDDEPPF